MQVTRKFKLKKKEIKFKLVATVSLYGKTFECDINEVKRTFPCVPSKHNMRGARALAFATAKHQSRGPFMAFQQTKETIGGTFTECSITSIFFTLDGYM